MNKRSRFRFLTHSLLVLYVLTVIYPLWFVVTTSMKNNTELFNNPWSIPAKLDFSNYVNVFSNGFIWKNYLNSIYVGTVATVATILLSTAIAYALTRMQFKRLNKLVYGFLLIALLIPPASLLIPLYIMVKDFGLYNSHLALIIPYASFGIPLTVFIVSAFLKSIPLELEEAGVMDGLSTFGLLGRIVIPVTIPTLVTVFILNFISNWNEYIMANLFLSNQELRTMPVTVVYYADKFNMNYGAMTASIAISVLPVIVIYAIFQRSIIEGVTAGSVKG
ncbi:carbohydrate ABC transporter permease [Paenibacillus sp. J5C_2022]|uniref:carbohydrate ABC transporter permease n=1 Tax=Paenibacillus sp. J5C2022 TaxID=2977129 RepID=UPI0021D3531F|nr:carbohydrate ABC transporter permease [Paenibacillus sp. J5C2022]MCU6710546.1 carbohydrate ABC transporter permease [Paenibacillus sp. J5C2022]